MKSKKGFTLIELLAVIIILGVLMIIAIPSVTTYIQNSRKSAYVDTAVAYVDAVRNKVNEASKIKFYATDTLYLIPVGHTTATSCISVETGGQSPFSDTWNYAYVGVTYTGEGYNYYFIGEDGASQGVPFLEQKVLADSGTDKIYSQTDANEDSAAVAMLKETYANHTDKVLNFAATSSDGVTAFKASDDKDITSLATKADRDKIQIITATQCSNS